jgi:hypothetical protein
MSALRMFIPITKVDAAHRLVYGLATAETEDRAGEICDYASTKPRYEKWSKEMARSTRGKSLGNLRAMHGPIAAGKVTAIDFNDGAKQIEICAKVVDDAEWRKVAEGVYTGFSQGGSYARRWTDADGRIRYTAEPNEISLVDLPCLPQARFEMIKADGTSELRCFDAGREKAARVSRLIADASQEASTLVEEVTEENEDLPSKLRALIARASAILQALVSSECAEDADRPPMTEIDATKKASRAGPRIAKVTPSKGEPDRGRIQQLHDAMVELGAACGVQKIGVFGLEKRFDDLSATLADVLQRVKRIEEQPLPLPLAGQTRAVGKFEDAGEAAEQLLLDPETLSVLAIKLAQRKGRAPTR